LQRWHLDWRPEAAGAYELRARATDERGDTRPDVVPFDSLGYLFGGVVEHPVNAV
jgi:hypothetical protein